MTPRPHSEQGARKREHCGRSSNPLIKVHDLAWLEFQKPDLVRAEAFAHTFGFTTVSRGADRISAPCGSPEPGTLSTLTGPPTSSQPCARHPHRQCPPRHPAEPRHHSAPRTRLLAGLNILNKPLGRAVIIWPFMALQLSTHSCAATDIWFGQSQAPS